jgi:polysaccharide pyruvyl transferase WcaK-like protein
MPLIFGTLKRIADILALIKGISQESAFLVKCHRNLKGVDLLIIAGSQQLIDYVGGPWAFPYTLFKWSVIARIVGTKVAFLSVGAGPINTRTGRLLDKVALSLAMYRSYRDDTSCRCVHQMGLKDDKIIVPDLVFSLSLPEYQNPVPVKTGSKVVGINPVPFGNSAYWIGGGVLAYQKYIHTLALFGLWLIEKGYIVRLFPTQLNIDPPVIKDIRSIMEKNASNTVANKIIDPPINTLNELITSISSMDYVVATRYHGVVLSFAINKPVLGIAYQPKTVDLMNSFGQKDFAIDIADLRIEEMRRRFEMLELNTEKACKQIRQEAVSYRKIIVDQYAHVIKLLNSDGGFNIH